LGQLPIEGATQLCGAELSAFDKGRIRKLGPQFLAVIIALSSFVGFIKLGEFL
jgi:hypothetical protein